jgi:DNA-binding MarR family transcriptional regulator
VFRLLDPPGAIGLLLFTVVYLTQLTAGNLSQHLGVLETAGLIEVEKGYTGRRGRTWITLTAAGKTALADEIGR